MMTLAFSIMWGCSVRSFTMGMSTAGVGVVMTHELSVCVSRLTKMMAHKLSVHIWSAVVMTFMLYV